MVLIAFYEIMLIFFFQQLLVSVLRDPKKTFRLSGSCYDTIINIHSKQAQISSLLIFPEFISIVWKLSPPRKPETLLISAMIEDNDNRTHSFHFDEKKPRTMHIVQSMNNLLAIYTFLRSQKRQNDTVSLNNWSTCMVA